MNPIFIPNGTSPARAPKRVGCGMPAVPVPGISNSSSCPPMPGTPSCAAGGSPFRLGLRVAYGTLPMKLSHVLLFALLASVLAASMVIVEVRFEGRRLQAELAEAERDGSKLDEYTRRLRIEVATRTGLAGLYLSAIEEQGLAVPSLSDGTLRYLEPQPEAYAP